MFLFANETVLDFYPQFGFRREIQYQYTLPVPTARGGARKLSVDSLQDLALLRACYKRGNPFSALQVVENFGLLMFYCGSFLKDCVYYIPQQNAVAVAVRRGLSCSAWTYSAEATWRRFSLRPPPRARSGPPGLRPCRFLRLLRRAHFRRQRRPLCFGRKRESLLPPAAPLPPTCSTLELISGITAWSE